MVAIAQLVEHLIVVQKVARSGRVSHPGETSEEIPRFFAIRGGRTRGTRLSRSQATHNKRNDHAVFRKRLLLRRDAGKIAAGMPEIVDEFADTSDAELAAIVAAERNGFLAAALNEEDGT